MGDRWEHRDYLDIDDDDDDEPGLEYADMDIIKKWVVKLAFKKDNEPEDSEGTGFLFSVPGMPQYHTILTAAHNLISGATHARTTDLRVIFSDPSVQPVAVKNNEDNVYICEDYKEGESNVDYGAIRIQSVFQDTRGFGFSMTLAYKSYFKGNVYVSGCKLKSDTKSQKDDKPICIPKTSAGYCITCYPEVVQYSAKTVQGISGSPVWIEHKGSQFVVAIHNNRVPGGGSGVRLTPELLQKVFAWLRPIPKELLQKDVYLYGEHKKYPDGIFLSFKHVDDFGCGRVRIGPGTKFDLIIAETMMDRSGNWNDRYAIIVADQAKRNWVMFRPSTSMVELAETMQERCLFAFQKGKKKRIRIVVNKRLLKRGEEPPNDISCQLKMDDDFFETTENGAESPEVLFVDYPDGDSLTTQFLFKPD